MQTETEQPDFSNLYVVLVWPENTGNVGFVARAMKNFGVQNLRIVGDDVREDQYAQMFSVHAKDVLNDADVFDDLEDALADIDLVWASSARAGGRLSVSRALVPLPELPNPSLLNAKIALVFGRESAGLTNDELALCDLVFTIPTSREYRSMNLSHAIAVTLYDIYRRAMEGVEFEQVRHAVATKRQREQVCIFFDELVDMTSLKDFKRPIAKQVFRNLLARAYITGREAATMTGTIRRIKELVEGEED